jgi:nucleotide sugar dehydrogenase
VNIGLANQFALFAEKVGIDVHAVIDACNSQPYSHIHSPGISVGGHCIPVYPRLYLSVDPQASIVRAARAVNAAMPQQVVARAAGVLGSLAGLRAVVLGASYRGAVKETAFSGVFATVAALAAHGAIVTVHDPMYTDEELATLGFAAYHYGQPADVVVLHTDHGEYRRVRPADLPGVRLLMDGRNITDPQLWEGIPRLVVGAGES